jgi:hypothetical protein
LRLIRRTWRFAFNKPGWSFGRAFCFAVEPGPTLATGVEILTKGRALPF